MSRYYSYLNTASTVLSSYQGTEPFALFIKKFFTQHKKYGSKDRKAIADLCYAFFRLGKAADDKDISQRILVSKFLNANASSTFIDELKPEWKELLSLSLEEKIKSLNVSVKDIFPLENELSTGIEYDRFCKSFLFQPDLFLRIRPGYEEIVRQKLQEAAIVFSEISTSCISLHNATKIEDKIQLNKEAVIQDFSSQRVGEMLHLLKEKNIENVWDCCAASGGKSILAKDILEKFDLTVSDIRENILHNLKIRFKKAGINQFKNFIADLSSEKNSNTTKYDLVIADLPCTGSGTWARTPEQLYYFEENKIEDYITLQRKILKHIFQNIKPNGYFLFITCSVFKKENEENVDFIKKNLNASIVKQEIFKGYDKNADTMFAALFQCNL